MFHQFTYSSIWSWAIFLSLSFFAHIIPYLSWICSEIYFLFHDSVFVVCMGFFCMVIYFCKLSNIGIQYLYSSFMFSFTSVTSVVICFVSDLLIWVFIFFSFYSYGFGDLFIFSKMNSLFYSFFPIIFVLL
jgi:hypothetical protein